MMTSKEMNAVVTAHYDFIAATVRKAAVRCGMVLSDEECAELTQDACAALLGGKLERFDASRGYQVSTFIGRCVSNHVIDHYRTTHYTREYDTTEGGRNEDSPAIVGRSTDNPERATIKASNARMLRGMLTAGEWSDLGDFLSPDYDENAYAARTGCNISAARARKSRLFSKVQGLLK